MIGVVVIDTQVGSNGTSGVVLILGVEILHRDTATESLADVVAISQIEGNVTGTECARERTVDSSSLNVAVATAMAPCSLTP